jgi:hypothetical protein
MVCYFVFIGALATEIAVFGSLALGLGATALWGGAGIFTAVMAAELIAMLILDKTTPFMLLFSLPFFLTSVAFHQAANSEMMRHIIHQLERVIRTPPMPVSL